MDAQWIYTFHSLCSLTSYFAYWEFEYAGTGYFTGEENYNK